jgi:3'-phosphoadenosine 5'-phosphosulfate sulfotransferase (PAPS reductase)/FAD synthetase
MPSSPDLAALNREFAGLTAEAMLKAALQRFPGIALASSFGAEDVVLIDMIVRLIRKRKFSRSTRAA